MALANSMRVRAVGAAAVVAGLLTGSHGNGDASIVLGAAPADQNPPAQIDSLRATFKIYLRTVMIGNEDVSVERSAAGWTITSSGRTDPPVDLTLRQVQVHYTPDWKPIDLSIDATVTGQSL